jgi:hypothetical protein
MRADIVAALTERRFLSKLRKAHRDRLIEDQGGDALDSVIACLAAASALHQLDCRISEIDRLEGKVFFEL